MICPVPKCEVIHLDKILGIETLVGMIMCNVSDARLVTGHLSNDYARV